jgi:ferrous iron transport protein B
MGVDGQTGVAILAAFAAREVFVSTLATLREVTDEEAGDSFTLPQAISLLFFFMITLQCFSTVAVQAQESGRWSMALLQLGIFNTVGYLGAIFLYQVTQSLESDN